MINKKIFFVGLLLTFTTINLNAMNIDNVNSVNDIISPSDRYVAGWKNNNPVIVEKQIKVVGEKKIQLIEKPIVFFDFNKAKVKKKYFNLIKEIADYMKKEKNTYVMLKGYTDKTGSNNYNYNLGLKRAENVKKLLIKFGVPKNRIVIYTYGKNNPLSQEEQKINRRVEIFIVHY